jgi:hypothetical protein
MLRITLWTGGRFAEFAGMPARRPEFCRIESQPVHPGGAQPTSRPRSSPTTKLNSRRRTAPVKVVRANIVGPPGGAIFTALRTPSGRPAAVTGSRLRRPWTLPQP